MEAWLAHRHELEAFLARRLGDRPAAEDIVQDLFLRMARQGTSFCAIGAPRAWLFKVARNALVDHARRSSRLVPLSFEDTAAPASDGHEPIDELTACIGRVIPRLAEDDARILRACEFDGLTVAEFARRRGIGLPAAKSRLFRARRRLRQALVEDCGVRFDEAGQVCCRAPSRP